MLSKGSPFLLAVATAFAFVAFRYIPGTRAAAPRAPTAVPVSVAQVVQKSVPVTLQFEKAGTVQLTLDVQAVGAKAPAGAAADHGGHQMAPGHSMAK